MKAEAQKLVFTQLVVLFALVLASAFFSASETAYSSVNRLRLKSLADAGNKGAALALRLTQSYGKLLSTVLVGNNIVNIACSAIATVLLVRLIGEGGVPVSTIAVTVVILLFGEIAPKAVGKKNAEGVAVAFARPLYALMVAFTPVNALLTAWQRFVLRLFGENKSEGTSEDELLTFVGDVRQEGGINADEENMIRAAIEYDDLSVQDVLTPRVDVVAAEIGDPVEKIAELFSEHGYSRLPIYRESIDNIVGFVLSKEFHSQVMYSQSTVESILKPVLAVPKSVKISALLKQMQKARRHIAVVMDEYGGTLGIVTTEDIVEELVGDIWDEDEESKNDIERGEDGGYAVLGTTLLPDALALFGLAADTTCATVGGWTVERIGHYPAEGESFVYEGVRVTVTEADKLRVLKVSMRGTDQEGEDMP